MEEANYIITAITTVLAVYAFVTALLLFVAQTETYNRVSHFWKQKGNRAWLVLFNSSRRHLIHSAFHKPLSIETKGLTYKKVTPVGEVGTDPECVFVQKGGRYELQFDYIAPRSAVIAEFEVDGNGKIDRPRLYGVLKGGRLVKCHFWFDDLAHCVIALLLAYVAFCVLVIGALLYLRSESLIGQGPFVVYAVGTVILAVGVYWFFCKNRRIIVNAYHEVRREMRKG